MLNTEGAKLAHQKPPALADGMIDRLVHNSHRIEMRGESMRKKRFTKPPD